MLTTLGLDFEVLAAEVDETAHPDEHPETFVQRIAIEKANAIASNHPDAWVLGADTVVVHEDKILGKPRDENDAFQILLRLSGQMHRVYTGFCIHQAENNLSVCRISITEVYFSPFSEQTAKAYVNTGEPRDKAGAYGIQGHGGVLVEKINGSYSNVVGLPLAEVIDELLHYGVIAPA